MKISSNKLVAIAIIVTLLSTTTILSSIPYDTPNMNYPNRMVAKNGTVFTTDNEKLLAWNITSKQLTHRTRASSRIISIDISSDEKLLMGTYEGEITVMDMRLEKLYNYSLPENITDVKWGPHGEIIAGSENGSIYITESGRNTTKYSTADALILSMAVSPDGKFLAVTYLKSEALVFALSNMSRVFVGPESSVSCSFSPDNYIAFAKTSELLVYNMSTGETILDEWMGHEPTYPIFLLWSPDGTKIFAAGWEENLRAWDVSSGEVLFELSPKHLRWACVDDSRIYIAGDYHVLVFDINGNEITYLPEDAEIPFLLPVSILTVVILTTLVMIEDTKRRKVWKEYERDENIIFAEKQVSIQEIALLSLLGLYIFAVFISYVAVKAWIFDFAPWLVAFMSLFLIINEVTSLLLRPLPFILQRDKIGIQTNLYQMLFKKKQRWISLSDIKRVSPHYFYNQMTKVVEERGVDFILIDGTVLSVLIRPTSKFLTTVEELQDYLRTAFGNRWERIFVDEPYIDMEEWQKIKHLADRKTGKNTVIFLMEVLVPILVLQIAVIMFPEFIGAVYEAGLFWPFFLGVLSFIVAVLVHAMIKQMKYNKAVTMKALMELKMSAKADISSYLSDKNKLNPDRFLHMSEEEWRKQIKIAHSFYRWVLVIISATVIYFTLILSSIEWEGLFIPIIASASFVLVLIFSQFFWYYKIEEAMALIKKAADYEIRTGETIMPEDIEIPSFLSMSGIISRAPITITPKEREIAEKIRNKGELWDIELFILMLASIFIPFVVLLAIDINTSVMPIFFGLMIFPLVLLIIYLLKRQKVLAKVKEAKRIEKLIEERKSRRQ